jgi:hypothetical protein
MKFRTAMVPLCIIAIVFALASASFAVGTLTGTITQAGTGAPIGGVSVALTGGPSTTTALDGTYSLSSVPAAGYTLTAKSTNHYIKYIWVVVNNGATTVANVVLVAIPAGTLTVVDTFTNRDGALLGTTTEDSHHYPWVLGAGETTASISGGASGQLFLATATAGGAANGVSIGGGFLPANFDLSVDITTTGTDWPGMFGAGSSTEGYLVYFTSAAVNGFSNIAGGGYVSGALSPTVNWSVQHHVRLRAAGPRQTVWVDNASTPVFDIMNYANTGPGYVGLFRYTNATHFDNLNVSVITTPTGVVKGKVHDAGNPSLGVANAVVTPSSGAPVTTGSDGTYTLTANADSTISITVAADNYYVASVSNIQPVPGVDTTADIAMTHLPTPLPADVVTDTFTNRDGPLAGTTTEDSNHYPWVLGSTESSANISGGALGKLVLGGTDLLAGVSLSSSFMPADFDMSVDMTIGTGSWGAITYREPEPGMYGGPNEGYLVFFPYTGTLAYIYRATTTGGVIASATLSTTIDWTTSHTVRVRAIGPYHTVWVGTDKVLDIVDSTNTGGGYIGLYRYMSTTTFDNLHINRYIADQGQISGTVYDLAHPSTRVAGAKVILSSGNTTTTDINGQYSFTRIPLAAYTVTVTATDYYVKSHGLALTSGAMSSVVDFGMSAIAAPTQNVADDFNRADGVDLGSTSVGDIPWDKAGETDTAMLSFGWLYLQGGDPHGVSLGSAFQPTDFQASLDMSIEPGSFGGILYRQSMPGVYDLIGGQSAAGAGYMVYFPSWGSYVALWRHGALTTTNLTTPIDWSTPRHVVVKVVGTHHQVWVDDQNVIDVLDSAKTTGGYFGIARYVSNVWADNLNIDVYGAQPTGTITGTLTQAGSPSVKLANAWVCASDGQIATTDVNGVYTLTVNAAGYVSLTAVAEGYSSVAHNSLEPIPGGSITSDFALTAISGTKAAYDSFSRPNSASLGTTEDSQHYAWESYPGAVVSIAGGTLDFTAGYPCLGVCLSSGFAPRDVDVTVSAQATTLGDWFGITYRQDYVGDLWNGYVAMFDAIGTTATVDCWQAGTLVSTHAATLATPINWSTSHVIRVKAGGVRHQIWIDGQSVLDVLDAARLSSGYVGLTRWNSELLYDNFTAVGGGKFSGEAMADIALAKAAADGTMVSLSGPVVTGVFGDCFYAEETKRFSAIRVESSKPVSVGDAVAVQGLVTTSNGEKLIIPTSVSVLSSSNVIGALGMTNRSNMPLMGLSNIGLLTTIWGRVTGPAVPDTYCYIDDGSGVSNELGIVGVKVLIAGPKKPANGDFVSCTGVSRIGVGSIPVIQMRSDDDLR